MIFYYWYPMLKVVLKITRVNNTEKHPYDPPIEFGHIVVYYIFNSPITVQCLSEKENCWKGFIVGAITYPYFLKWMIKE